MDNPQGQPQVVSNPALGPAAPQIHLPQGPAAQPAPVQPGQPAPGPMWQQAPQQPYNPYSQPQQTDNPYQPVQQANPYGQPQQPQVSPYAAPPQGMNPYLAQGQVPAGQAAPPVPGQVQQPQQQPNPAYQFNPYAQQQPQPQAPQQPQNPFAQLPAQVQQPAAKPEQLSAQQLAQQPGGITDAQVKEIFPDATSQAIFQGMTAVSQGQNIDLLAAFGQAYERRDPSLVNERYLAQFDPATVATLKSQFTGLVAQGTARDEAVNQQVYAQAGGKEAWDAAVSVFNRIADNATMDAVISAVQSGNPQLVRLGVSQILSMAQQSGQLVQRSGQLLTPNGGGQVGREVMTRDNFYRHLDLLEQAHPKGSPQYNQHYADLVKQRSAAKAAGHN